jgi:hypothetical protein
MCKKILKMQGYKKIGFCDVTKLKGLDMMRAIFTGVPYEKVKKVI